MRLVVNVNVELNNEVNNICLIEKKLQIFKAT